MLSYDPIEPEHDTIFNEAVNYILDINKASATLFQRHFRIGFARAMSLMDELEHAGIIGPVNGAKPRLILINSKADLGSIKPPKQTIEEVTAKSKWKKTTDTPKKFIVHLGTDEKGAKVNLDLEKYGNLIIVGSQMTGVNKLVNQIITQKVQEYSPDDLKLIIVDGFINQIELPHNSPHLLTPIVSDASKIKPMIMWLQDEIVSRLRSTDREDNPKILLVINGFNEIIYFTPSEVEARLSTALSFAQKAGIYVVITVDYLDTGLSKLMQANIGAKVVFKPTTHQMARSSGIFETIKLESPDEAILETMFEGKTKLTINNVDVKKIYKEIYE
jgi:DNA segregation ATPase FtsK/SpoIIIE-like protein